MTKPKKMTSIPKQEQLPRISAQDLKILSFAPGTLRVIVKKVDGYFLPFVHFDQPNGDTQLHGIVIDGENVLATVELADIVTALEEIIGVQHTILTPDIPDGITMH